VGKHDLLPLFIRYSVGQENCQGVVWQKYHKTTNKKSNDRSFATKAALAAYFLNVIT
jgi:hypothetical protein